MFFSLKKRNFFRDGMFVSLKRLNLSYYNNRNNMKKIISPSSVHGTVTAPSSKSYAQRAVAVAALAHGESVLRNIGSCDDTDAALSVAQSLGASVQREGNDVVICGVSPSSLGSGVLNIGESGLSTRLFTPVASLSSGEVTVTGHGSILSRPVSMMEAPLRSLGVEIETTDGHLPLRVRGPLHGGEVEIDGSISSQFLTGLLTALPLAEGDSTIIVDNLASRPYIDMTCEVLRSFGVHVTNDDYTRFFVKGGQRYTPQCYNIEGDWSGASCLLVAGALCGDITVRNLHGRSMQADKAILEALDYAGASISIEWEQVTVSRAPLNSFSFDATHCPDLFPALVALAAGCRGESTLLGTGRLTHKESDRAKVLIELYRAMGIEIDGSYDDALIVKGGDIKGGVSLSSHGDHRMAMSIAVSALRADSPIEIDGAEAVTKSYTGFFDDLAAVSVSTDTPR